jgi:hypothetical protein
MFVDMWISDSVKSHSEPVRTTSSQSDKDLAAFVTMDAIIVGVYHMGHVGIPRF